MSPRDLLPPGPIDWPHELRRIIEIAISVGVACAALAAIFD